MFHNFWNKTIGHNSKIAQLEGPVNLPAASLQWGALPPHECPGYITKQSDGEVPALELWGMGSTPSLPSLPGPLWSRVIAPERVLSMDPIELFDIENECKQITYAELKFLKKNCLII